ncbi:hypothetical protein NDU88_005789 [Pleurodeles waltl]|uniref:Uncharacterized protein n=1 Tax=Pleurodeles waltl TaxID=8319 RepID=A0AAV7MXD8_PLEWA|nr:hypothetical protein NDU88_005789 [Pleurodeles waltl]
MAELKGGFQAINSRFDTLDASLSRMKEHIDRQVARMDGAECRKADVENDCVDTQKHLERDEHLKAMASKNKDLEAR